MSELSQCPKLNCQCIGGKKHCFTVRMRSNEKPFSELGPYLHAPVGLVFQFIATC